MTQTLAQQRAGHALKQVEDFRDRHEEGTEDGATKQKQYVAYVSKFPYMILNNGLGQACAFFLSKKEVHEMVYKDLEAWLTQQDRPYHNCGGLIKGITDEDQADYVLAQAEALAYLEWLRKFAKAFLKEPDGSEVD
jgi:CRISPR-associated protein Cmr5